MSIKIALVGNPNSGKTTLFNALTGSNQYVGNWPGVTVEKKEGKVKGHEDVYLTDLPGIYSLSPYTLEEVVAREYLINENPDAILNIIDGTNLERNLYLTTQLTELGIPVVSAINMLDVYERRGDKIDIALLSKYMGCKFVEISALKGTGIQEAAEVAIEAAKHGKTMPIHAFSGEVEHALAHIEEAAVHNMAEERQRWYAVKIFERDEKIIESLGISPELFAHIDHDIRHVEAEFDDDAESIITNERYNYLTSAVRKAYVRKNAGHMTISDKIDRIVTNRILALPIFALAMLLVYTVSIGTVGDLTVTFMNDILFGTWVIPGATALMESLGCWPWLVSLVSEGILGGIGAVLGFVPQMLILFFMLSILEDIGYMSRVAFIMDKLFRKFGLSGKSFIPLLVASGCGVPGVMASRTIEQDRDRKMTIMTTCFIPCGAKMPIVALIAGALFGNAAWVATSAYFIGIAAVVISGIILKKTKLFAGDPAPFVMELPSYHLPVMTNILRTTGERGWSFVKRAGTVILAAGVIIWVLNSLSFEGGFHYITEADGGASILELLGSVIAFLFKPLGFGSWQAAVATILGLVAKEEVVGVFGSLTSMANAELALEMVESGSSELALIGQEIFGGKGLSAFSFMVFNLLCAPCFAAMGAIRREMDNPWWTAFAITYMTVFAYGTSFVIYQLGMLFTGAGNILGGILAFLVVAAVIFLMVRPYKESTKLERKVRIK